MPETPDFALAKLCLLRNKVIRYNGRNRRRSSNIYIIHNSPDSRGTGGMYRQGRIRYASTILASTAFFWTEAMPFFSAASVG